MPSGEQAGVGGHAGASAAGFSGRGVDALAQLDGRRSNGTFAPGNRISLLHGRRSRRAELRRAETMATMKLARTLLKAAGAMPGRCRPRPLRLAQIVLLAEVDPAGLAVAFAMGLDLPGPR